MREIIPAKKITGTINAPPSKAHTLRAIIIASLAKGESTIKNGLIAEDQEYAIKAMQQLGAQINIFKEKNEINIIGVNGKPIAPKETIFIGNSGLTVRFLVSIAALAQGNEFVTLDGVERMRTGRPLQDLLDALTPLGVEATSINQNGCPPIKVKSNSFFGGNTNLAGDKSSQYFSSILIAAPYAKKDTEIKTIGHLSSKPYIDVTIQSMKEFGVNANCNNYESFNVKSEQKYIGREINIEGDYSNAAYFFAAAAIMNGKVRVNNLNKESKQGDKFFINALEKMGCKVIWEKDYVILEGTNSLKGLGEVDMNDYPDIVMPLAVVSAFANGITKITNVEHLRIKESDRLSVTVNALKQLGVDAKCGKDYLLVNGNLGKELHGATIDSNNDHRIAMSFTIAGLKIPNVIIENERAVDKSFPSFYEEIEKIIDKINKKIIFLIGYRGTGKTVIGKKIAEKLGTKFIDLDEEIVKRAGKTIPEIFSNEGETKFREYESNALKNLIEEESVVSCGGGIITQEKNINLLKEKGIVILLTASPEVIYSRIHKDKNRPALTDKDPLEEIKHMLKTREGAYSKAKDIEYSTNTMNANEVVTKIVEDLKKH